MTEPIVYDKAKYHYDGNFPAELEIEQGFVHTGMFLGWVIDHDLYSDWFGSEMKGYLTAFKNREMSGAKVFEACDGVFVDDMLTDEGNAFAQNYFDFERGKYLADYTEVLGQGLPTIYHVADTWINYDKLRKRIDKRYRELQRGSSGGWRSFFKRNRKPR